MPIPFALALLLTPVGENPVSPFIVFGGVAVTLLGEVIRLWGVHHIGAISRTRTDRLGPLIDSGPFAIVRNPLYIGNIGLWVGVALTARLLWMAPIIALLLAAEYHAIVKWEEQLLLSRLGEPYRDYTTRVPRWIPGSHRGARGERGTNQVRSANSAVPAAAFSWKETLFSERGTLVAIAAGYVLLWLKLTTWN
ncbi:MAG: isoprenylcysteine carboxylmethyltransferase family protein [Acidobacteriia bacterium]|nr:isoprenylcysteine carboxylmethyltransferase family protein [Terriglobia bacterium]